MKKSTLTRIIFSIALTALIFTTAIAINEIYKTNNDMSLKMKAKMEMHKLKQLKNEMRKSKKDDEISHMVMVNGKLYADTGEESDMEVRCGTLDGEITSKVDASTIPEQDGQCNFEGARGYQYIDDEIIDICTIDGRWLKFKSVDE